MTHTTAKTNQITKKLVPQLRFPEFSGEWENSKMINLFPKIRNGFVGVATPYYSESGIKYLQGKNIKNNRIDDKELIHIKEEFHLKKKNSILKENDILIVQSGHVGECAVVTDEYVNANCHALLIATPNNNIESKFYVYFFYTSTGLKRINKITTGNTIKRILSSDIKNVLVPVPQLSEQQKIAAFLTTVDKKISLLQQQQTALETYKKGLLQQLFSQQIRFKDDNENNFPDWEEKRLGEMCKLVTKGTTPTSVGFSFLESGINFIKAENISKDYFIDVESTPKISTECNDSLKRSKLEVDDLLFSIAGTLGRTAIVRKKDLPANTNQALAIIRLKDKNYVRYLNYFLNSKVIKKRISQLLSVGAQPNLSLNQVNSFKISVPSLPEQTKIANFLSLVDKRIENVQQQIQKTQEFKKGLLQQLFV